MSISDEDRSKYGRIYDEVERRVKVEADRIARISLKYTAAERQLIQMRGAPCLTCRCSDVDRQFCEAW